MRAESQCSEFEALSLLGCHRHGCRNRPWHPGQEWPGGALSSGVWRAFTGKGKEMSSEYKAVGRELESPGRNHRRLLPLILRIAFCPWDS